MHPILLDDRHPEMRRVRRDLDRLQALAGKRRVRSVAMRLVRGFLGGGASFAALLKLKLAGSLLLKGGLALIIGLCLAWPIILVGLLAVFLAALALATLFDGGDVGSLDCPCDCWKASRRRDRLLDLIDVRVRWLAEREGPPPRRLSAAGRA